MRAEVAGSLSPDHAPVPAGRLLALFLVSAGLLLQQIALTKIFSIVLWYHFGFLVISIAMLGFAISGVVLARWPDLVLGGGALFARLSGWAALASAATLWLVVHTRVDAFSLIADRNEGALVFIILALILPFFFMGAAVSATLTLHRERAAKVYSANLLGSGAGCGLAIALFDGFNLSAPDVVLVSALLVALGGLCFALDGGRASLHVPAAAALAIALVLGTPGREGVLHLAAPSSKPLSHVEKWDRENRPQLAILNNGDELVYTSYEFGPEGLFAKTPFGDTVRVDPEQIPRGPDGKAVSRPTSLVEFTEWTSLSRVDAFTWPRSLPPWGLWGLSSRFQGDMPRQKGITIDSWAMTNVPEWRRYDEAGDGRPHEVLEYLPAGLVHRIRPGAEILCIGAGGGMDLMTAERFGAKRIVGVEINPGVVRAVKTAFLDFQGRLYDPEASPHVEIHVAEGRHFLERDLRTYDIVQLSGVDTASTTQAGAFTLSENFLYTIEAFETYLERTNPGGLVTLTRWVLPDQKTGHPRETLRLFTLAYTALQNAGIEDPARHLYLVESRGFSVILFGKDPFTDAELATLDTTSEALAFRPLYHPLRPSPWNHPVTREPIQNQWEAFAAAPDKAKFYADYPYDVSPPRDDRPFFFEVSRFRHLFERESFFNPLGGITAHGILMVLLVLLAGVAWFFVIAPLRRLARDLPGSRTLPVLGYFAALGSGFILVEVVLAQRFILYLGNPLYSLAVVLFGILIFSGVGSALSGRVKEPRRALGVVVLFAVLFPWVSGVIFDATLMWSTPMRIVVSLMLLAPLGLAMGMPFPLGLARIARGDSRLTAWAWGVNGYTSVIGSVLTIVLSIAFGFSAVIWIAATIYAGAWVLAPKLRPAA